MDLSFERWRGTFRLASTALVSDEILLEMLARPGEPDRSQMLMILINKVNVE
ncbi:MAG TPA: hypothetical protein VIN75_22305 [Burkholderiaceae bacterium]